MDFEKCRWIDTGRTKVTVNFYVTIVHPFSMCVLLAYLLLFELSLFSVELHCDTDADVDAEEEEETTNDLEAAESSADTLPAASEISSVKQSKQCNRH